MAELRHHLVERDLAIVDGPDATGYLQGQLSQDIAAIAVGSSAWSWLLAPAGKVDALVRVTRTGPDTLLVDTDGGWGETLVNRLTRFKLRTKVDIAATTRRVLALRGDGAAGAAAEVDGGVVVPALWGGEEAVDVLLDSAAPTSLPGDELGDGWEAARIAAGVPVMGAELTERTIPAETGLIDLTVSFTKGCYTGQELVARIDSRGGNVARHLRLLHGPEPLAVGAELTVGGKVVGTVTSAASSAPTGAVALAYVARSVAPGDGICAGDTAVDVLALPPRS
jgi:folate-binding protein YgfZ